MRNWQNYLTFNTDGMSLWQELEAEIIRLED
jgi:hypothetical protein